MIPLRLKLVTIGVPNPTLIESRSWNLMNLGKSQRLIEKLNFHYKHCTRPPSTYKKPDLSTHDLGALMYVI